MSEDVREAFEQKAVSLGYAIGRCNVTSSPKCDCGRYISQALQDAWDMHQAATTATDAKWRGLVEKLVGASKAIEPILDEANNLVRLQGFSGVSDVAAFKQAITEAAQMLGGK